MLFNLLWCAIHHYYNPNPNPNPLVFDVLTRACPLIFCGVLFAIIMCMLVCETNAERTYPTGYPTLFLFLHLRASSGHICLNILREDWRPVLNLQSIIVGLMFLFLQVVKYLSFFFPFLFF